MPIPFFADIGWFYLAAKDALFSGQFPLVGITTSVIWLHQGPIWTYFLIPAIYLFAGHPASGVFLTILFYFISIILAYWAGRILFGRRQAVISALLFMSSPILIISALTPFVTSLVPAFSLLMLILLLRRRYFLTFLVVGFLFQLERISLIFWPSLLIQLYRQRYQVRIIDLIGLIIGVLPLILAGPIELFGPVIFAVYKTMSSASPAQFNWSFYTDLLAKLVFPLWPFVSQLLLLSTGLYLAVKKHPYIYWFILPLVLLYLSKTASDAYFIQILPLIVLPLAFFISKQPLILLVVLIIGNLYSLPQNHFFMGFSGYGLSLSQKTRLVNQTGYYPQNLKIIGPGQQFASVTDPYHYLYWYTYRHQTPQTSVTINEYLQMLQ